MTGLLAGPFGAGVGLGVVLIVAGLRGRPVLPDRFLRLATVRAADRRGRPLSVGVGSGARRQAVVIGTGLGGWLVSGAPGVGALAVCAVLVAPRLFGAQNRRKEWIARSEAIAAWTEMLRDTMVAADGVEGAIAATVPIAPRPVRQAVAMLDARRRSEATLPQALAAFAAELDHPAGDLVVTALIAAAEGEGSDFTRVLTRLAVVTRADVAMRHEIEASRAQVHTAGRMILGALVLTSAGFWLVSRDYFGPYDGAGGQVALMLVAGLFTGGAVVLERMSRVDVAERFAPRWSRSASPAGGGAE